MRLVYIKYCFIICCLLLFSCKKVINVNLNSVAPQIVIEGNVTNAYAPYQVQITQTVNFSASNVFPAVSGALVKITDNTAAITDTLKETSAGVYTTNIIKGIPGHTYQLYVVALGQTYTAISTMPQPVLLDSVSFQRSNLFGKTNINPTVNFQDPAGITNYYIFREYIKGKINTYAFDDRLSDGKYISLQLYTDSLFVGDTANIQMNCVDKNIYNYFNALGQNLTGGNNQPISPSNPVSNISNNALGYFNAGTIIYKKRVVQ